MATYTVNAAAVGTALVSVAGTITGITLTQPAAGALNSVNINDSVVLVDATATNPRARTLYSTTVGALMYVFGVKPGIPATPGLTLPTWPLSLGTMSIPFTNGIFVRSCPANLTLTVTA